MAAALRGSLFSRMRYVKVQASCLGESKNGEIIIFNEKRRSCPASLQNADAFCDLSVGPAMFFL
jgi:hypothetical protein